jgi:hypothetical protein
MRRKLMLLLMSGALAGGCVDHVQYRGSVAVTAATPDLAYVSPGVYVIANYDEPIFYVDGCYWWQYGGVWYRSDYYRTGWVIATPPLTLARIERPHVYRHYRPHGFVANRRPVPFHHVQRPVVRDHRARSSPYRRR